MFVCFGMPIKTLGSLGKIRVGRVTGNTHIFFFGLNMCLSLQLKRVIQTFNMQDWKLSELVGKLVAPLSIDSL